MPAVPNPERVFRPYKLAPLVLAAVLGACASHPPGPLPSPAARAAVASSRPISRESIGVFRTHMGAEIAAARYASVGGAAITPVSRDGRRLWRVDVIGRIGESPQSLRRRLASVR